MTTKAGKSRSLGINTDVASAKPIITYKDIEVARAKGLERHKIFVLLLRLKWQRMDTAQRIFPLKFEKDEHGKLKKQQYRISMCHKIQIKPFIEIHYSDELKRARYGRGLMLCGSPHICPVCKLRITEFDRGELEKINFDKLGLHVALATFTLSHSMQDGLVKLCGSLDEAMRKIRSGRRWQNFADKYSYVGAVTGSETTINFVNGWHPHKHSLFLFDEKPESAEEMQNDLYDLYSRALDKVGGYASRDHGVNVLLGDNASMVAQYVAKWGHDPKEKTWTVQAELTKASVKIGMTGESVTPDQLLDIVALGGERSKWAEAKYKEYAAATFKKKRLSYTKGLRARLGLGREYTDMQKAETDEPKTRLLALLRPEHWKIIEKQKLRAWVIIDAAKSGDFQTFQNALADVGIMIDEPYKYQRMTGTAGKSRR
jgi:hypothetical protein